MNPSNGVLTPLAGSPFTLGGSFPIAYATDTGGRLFSATNEDNQVRAFTTSGGVPTAVSGNPFAAPGLNDALSGVVHPAGFYMVAAENSGISVYQIAGSGAATTLTNVAGSPFATGGTSPTSLALSKDGKLLIANNGESRNLTVFSVNSSTGALTPLSTSAFEHARRPRRRARHRLRSVRRRRSATSTATARAICCCATSRPARTSAG